MLICGVYSELFECGGVILGSTGARIADPEHSLPGPERWASHLVSKTKQREAVRLGFRNYLHILSSVCTRCTDPVSGGRSTKIFYLSKNSYTVA